MWIGLKRIIISVGIACQPAAQARLPGANGLMQDCSAPFLIAAPPPAADSASFQNLSRDTFFFLLSAFYPVGASPFDENLSRFQIDCATLPVGARTAVEAARRPGTEELDLRALKAGITQPYLDERARRGPAADLPNTLGAFMARARFSTWARTVVPLSAVKDLTRVIYQSPPDYRPRTWVAQTLGTTTGDLNAPVHETELILERIRDDEGEIRGDNRSFDFYAYDPAGQISYESDFHGTKRALPAVCLGCHYDPVAHSFRPRSLAPR